MADAAVRMDRQYRFQRHIYDLTRLPYLLGRDTLRYGTISVLAGSSLLVIGAIMNRAYLKEVLLFRGAARRGERTGEKNSRLNQTPPKTRIR